MKKIEKIVPVALAGLVLTGAGTVEAQAIDEIVVLETPEGEEEKVSPGAPSADIKSVISTEKVETEEGDLESKAIINVDTDGDTATSEGTLDLTETPGGTTIVNTPDGDPTVETITNPDGSTTTTTTQTTTNTITENSSTDITGEVTSPSGEPSQEEKDEVKNQVESDLEENKKPDGTIDWDSVKETYKDAEIESDGNGKTTIKFADTSESEKPLTSEELDKVLEASGLTKNEDGTYTRADGAIVTVTVNSSEGSEITTTEWIVTVTESLKTETGTVEGIDTPVITTPGAAPIEDEKDGTDLPSAEEILTHIKDGDWNEDGTAIWQDGTVTYTVKRVQVQQEISAEGLSNSQIEALLPADSGITLKEDGKFYKEIAGTERELTFEEVQSALTRTTYEFTVTKTDSQGDTEDHDATQAEKDKAQATAETQAVRNALTEAIKADNGGVLPEGTILRPVKVDETTYRCEIVKDGKTYTYTVNVDLSTGEAVAWTEDDERITGDVAGGATATVTGSAYVSSETVVWGPRTKPLPSLSKTAWCPSRQVKSSMTMRSSKSTATK